MSDKAFTIENVGMMPCHPGEFSARSMWLN